MTDLELMRIAIEEAKKSQPEDSTPRPRVGVVFGRDGEVIEKAHRNEDGSGAHAEYIALKKIEASGKTAQGATVYTTLEPCVYRKKRDKIPCAQRLITAGVSRVVFGMIDPHKTVQSKGIVLLRANQIKTESFPDELLREIETLNAEFNRAFTVGEASAQFIADNQGRSLQEWYLTVNRIYWRQNLMRSPAELLNHLVETVVGVEKLDADRGILM
jgi:pyrimidine deaminase RibD-like protein